MNRTIQFSAVCAAVAAMSAVADSQPKPEDAMPLLAARVGAIREAAMKEPSVFAEYLADSGDGERAAAEWAAVADEFSATQLRDFFSGAGAMLGTATIRGAKWSGVCALYNPWLDALLALRFDDAMRIDRVAMVGGEAFRGEKPASPPATATVVPADDPLSVELWRVQSRTAARFSEIFPAGEEVRFDSALASARRRGFEAVQVRSALHLKLLSEFAKLDDWGRKPGSSKLAAAASKMQTLLRRSKAETLKRRFDDPAHAFFCDTFAELPADTRAGFGLYNYVPSKDGTLFVFLNPALPRLYATVSFPAGRENDPSGPPVIFEWYDLAQAAQLLEAARPGEMEGEDALARHQR